VALPPAPGLMLEGLWHPLLLGPEEEEAPARGAGEARQETEGCDRGVRGD
jgi:hypothetical protein